MGVGGDFKCVRGPRGEFHWGGVGADILIQEDRPRPETEVWNFDPTWPR